MGTFVLALAAVAFLFWLAHLIGAWFPRTGAYLLGPVLSLFAVVCLVVLRRDIFGSLHPLFGVALVAMAIAALVLMITGLARIQRADETGESPMRPGRGTREFNRFRPRESGWLGPRKFVVLVVGVELLIALVLLAF